MRSRTITILFCCAALFAAAGCASEQSAPRNGNNRPGPEIVMTGHSPVSIENYRIAREYSATGRYELAREHFLLAYAAAENDAAMRDMLARELKAIDLMIRTLR